MTQGYSYLECFDSYREVVLLPHSHVHLPVLASSQFVLHGDIRALHLPLVMDGRHTVHCGLVAFGCRVVQGGDEAVGYCGVVVDQLGQRGETALRCHIHLGGGGVRSGYGGRKESKTRGKGVITGPHNCALISLHSTVPNLSVRGSVDPVVVDSPLVAKRD